MNKYSSFLLILFLQAGIICFGNDTTLYNKRVEKIKTFSKWLYNKSNEKNSDTSSYSKVYDTAITLFFDTSFLKPGFNLKLAVKLYDRILEIISPDSFLLKIPEISRDTLLQVGTNQSYFQNTIIFYLPMYGLEFEGFYFEFLKNSSDLIYLIDAGGPPEYYKYKKEFLNNLQAKH